MTDKQFNDTLSAAFGIAVTPEEKCEKNPRREPSDQDPLLDISPAFGLPTTTQKRQEDQCND